MYSFVCAAGEQGKDAHCRPSSRTHQVADRGLHRPDRGLRSRSAPGTPAPGGLEVDVLGLVHELQGEADPPPRCRKPNQSDEIIVRGSHGSREHPVDIGSAGLPRAKSALDGI